MNPIISELKAESDRLEWDALYTMKSHFNAAMLWNAAHYTLGLLTIILGACAGKKFVGSGDAIIASAIATTSAALATIITFLKPSEKARPHHDAGVDYGSIKRKARMFQNISVNLDLDANELRRQLEELVAQYHKRQKSSPPIPAPAYWLARLGVRQGEHAYNEPGEKK